MAKEKLNISEIFYSLQGEGSRAGLPCIFVRTQGCRLRCSWCDTAYALELKQSELMMSPNEIMNIIKSYKCRFVEFTGGEPLEQEGVYELMSHLCDEDYNVAVETSGYILLDKVDPRVIKILDIKCPGSGMHKKNNYDNISLLNLHDEVKFVIASREDYDFAKSVIIKYNLHQRVSNVLMSPAFYELETRQLAEWILADFLPVRMQVQMHKYIWHPDKRGV